MAEAERMAESEAAEAAARERAQIATVQADRTSSRSRTSSAPAAKLEAIAKAKEEEASVAGDIACHRRAGTRAAAHRAGASPPRGRCHARQGQPRSQAARRSGPGRQDHRGRQGAGRGVPGLTEQYQAAGDDGQRIFVLNMLQAVDKIVSTVNNVDIDRVAIVDNGGGQGGGIPGLVSLAGAVVSLTEQIEAATGVDILGSMRSDQGIGAGFGTSTTTAGTGSLTSRPAAA